MATNQLTAYLKEPLEESTLKNDIAWNRFTAFGWAESIPDADPWVKHFSAKDEKKPVTRLDALIKGLDIVYMGAMAREGSPDNRITYEDVKVLGNALLDNITADPPNPVSNDIFEMCLALLRREANIEGESLRDAQESRTSAEPLEKQATSLPASDLKELFLRGLTHLEWLERLNGTPHLFRARKR